MKIGNRKILTWILCLGAMLFSACDFVYEGAGECPKETNHTARVLLIADINLTDEDTFNENVTSIWLYAFDETETLAWESHLSAAEIATDEEGRHYIPLDGLPEGNYKLIAWGGLAGESSFTVPDLAKGISKMEELTCYLSRKTRAEEIDLVDTNITDLFHGMIDITINEAEEETQQFEMHLTKDTNKITIVLEEVNGETIDIDNYEFTIEAGNGHLNYDNSLLNETRRFVYSPWSQQYSTEEYDVEGDFITSRKDAGGTRTSSVEAELTVSRLVQNDWTLYTQPMLTITEITTGSEVLSIPLIDYALKVRDKYRTTTDVQDYLDRQDTYQMVFFLDNGKWMNSVIYIDSWRIVLNIDDLY